MIVLCGLALVAEGTWLAWVVGVEFEVEEVVLLLQPDRIIRKHNSKAAKGKTSLFIKTPLLFI